MSTTGCDADDVYVEMKRKTRDAILQLIELERDGEQIERTLLKNVLSIFIEVGMGTMSCYQQDFEATLLKTTAEYYKRKAAFWIEEDSCPDYMVHSVCLSTAVLQYLFKLFNLNMLARYITLSPSFQCCMKTCGCTPFTVSCCTP